MNAHVRNEVDCKNKMFALHGKLKGGFTAEKTPSLRSRSSSSQRLPLREDISVGAAVLQRDPVSSVRNRVPNRVERAVGVVDGHVLQHRRVPHKGVVPVFHLR